MKTKQSLFQRFFHIEVKQEQKDLDWHISDKESSWMKQKLRLERKVSGNEMEFRYLVTSRAGIIKVVMEKNRNTIKITVREGVLGFFLPFACLIGSIIFLYTNITAALILFGIAVFFLVFIYLNFMLMKLKRT